MKDCYTNKQADLLQDCNTKRHSDLLQFVVNFADIILWN